MPALARLYTRDAVFFGLLPQAYVGRSEIERYCRSYQGVLKSVALNFVEQEVRLLALNVFAAQGFGDIVNFPQDGDISPNRVRTSLVIVKADGLWRIALRHFSQIPERGA